MQFSAVVNWSWLSAFLFGAELWMGKWSDFRSLHNAKSMLALKQVWKMLRFWCSRLTWIIVAKFAQSWFGHRCNLIIVHFVWCSLTWTNFIKSLDSQLVLSADRPSGKFRPLTRHLYSFISLRTALQLSGLLANWTILSFWFGFWSSRNSGVAHVFGELNDHYSLPIFLVNKMLIEGPCHVPPHSLLY